MPFAIRSGILACASGAIVGAKSARGAWIAAIPGALQTKSHARPPRPESVSPQASQSFMSAMSAMSAPAATIEKAMVAEPAELATAPAAKATSAKIKVMRARTFIATTY